MSSRELRIHLWPEPVLSRKASPVRMFNKDFLLPTFERMSYLMGKTNGIGLAAPQVGIPETFFIMAMGYSDTDVRNGFIEFVGNPEITAASEDLIVFEEGCLSLPNQTVPVNRHSAIEVKYKNIDSKEIRKTLSGLEAICFQHESDHLNGITIIDRIKQGTSARKEAEKIMALQKKSLPLAMPDIYK